MRERITVDAVDTDGAIQETFEGAMRSSRGTFLKTALVAGGTLTIGGLAISGLPKLVLGQPSPAQDAEILNFALTLEYLEAAFYTRAENGGALNGELARFARVVGAHERAHVDFLQGALGGQAVQRPRFNFQGTTRDPDMFTETAIALEDTGVAAYNGAGPMLTPDTLAAAATIVSVEARHAAWIRDIAGENPAPDAVDPARSRRQVLAVVNDTGFLVS
jgi:hypothetical protein